MAAIDIDFDVYKALTSLRESEEDTYNDVLRKLLVLDKKSVSRTRGPNWVWKGVTLPSGSELRANYKGRLYEAQIKNGVWVQDQATYTSPSAAAYAITKSGINGWGFWQVKRPSDAVWLALHELRTAQPAK